MKTTPLFYEMLLTDHRKTEACLEQMNTLLQAGTDWAGIERLYHTLEAELNCHFACEEYGLFPVLSQYKTMVLMETEHDDLLESRTQFYQELCQSLADKTPTENLMPRFEKLRETLMCHIKEEEQGVFPMADDCLEPEEKALVQRKLAETMAALQAGQPAAQYLTRPVPVCQLSHQDLFGPPEKPRLYQKLFGAEHAGLHHVQLQAGESFKMHWAPEHQCLLVIAGEVLLTTETEEHGLAPGDQVTMDPRFPFALQAQSDCHLLVVKVYPRPHFIRKPQP